VVADADHQGGVVTQADEARKWHRVIRDSVREACETWRIQRQAGPVTSEALEAIVYRGAVPILTLLQDQAPKTVAALVPTVVRIMLAAAVEVLAEERDALDR
jgi:hypothetical protein